MDAISTKKAPERTEALLGWHKPEVQRLTVSLDTRDGRGSQQASYVSTGAAA